MTSRILLADDSITIQKVVNLTFADEGIEVVAVSNGEQAERRLSEICPDLVLADIFMPGKNGYELCEFVKQSPQFRNVPVVLLVGAFEPFNEAEARRVRADAHLTKPFESRTLVDTVRKLISMSGRSVTGSPSASVRAPEDDPPVLTPAPDASSVALPSFNLDLSGMSPEWEANQPAQQPNTFTNASDVPLNSAAPLELDYGSFGNSDNAPTGFQMEVEERASNVGFSFASSVKDTAELPPIEEEQPAPVDTKAWGQTEPVQVPPVFSDSEPPLESADKFGAPFEAHEETQGFKVRSTFEAGARDSVLDFDRLDSPESSAPDNIVSFDVDFSAATDSGRPVGGFEVPAEQPPAVATSEEQSASPEVSEEFGESPFELVQETTPGTLSVDDPLGDVLSVEPSQMQPVEHGVNGGTASFPPQAPETFGSISSTEPEPLEDAPPVSQFPFDEEPSAAPSDRPGGVVHSGLSFEAFSPVPEEPVQPKVEPSVWEEPVEAKVEPSAWEAPVHARVEPSAWEEPAPTRVEPSVWEEPFSKTAEPSVWEGGRSDVLSELTEPVEAAPPGDDNSFTASEMWAAAETEFAAIDIEAVAVDEQPSLAEYGESPDPETGFAFAPVTEPAEETQASIAEHIPAPPEPVQPAAAVTQPPPEGLVLSPSLIDEIVRRVVAEMGDAVVREIAWEVVPDCVERVVEKLSNEGAAKRM